LSGNIEHLSDHIGRRFEPLAADAVTVLRAMGGSAHFSVLFGAICATRRRDNRPISDSLKDRLGEALERFRQDKDHPEGDGRALFYRPFGDHSFRWALCRDVPSDVSPFIERAPLDVAGAERGAAS
jgi:hypothetical protein